MKLTKSTIEKAVYQGTGESKYILWDEELANFGVRIFPSGIKSFVTFYRVGSRQRFMTLGKFGVMTVDEARQRARKLFVEVADGKDPLADRQKARHEQTVRQLAERYPKEHAAHKKKATSRTEDNRLLKTYILPKLGSLPVTAVSREDVDQLHHSLAKTPIQANRVLALISTLMTFAERWNLRPQNTNPAKHVDRFKERVRERIVEGNERKRLVEVLDQVELDLSEPIEAVHAIRLLLLTGCRRGEILTLKWEYIDEERSRIVLPDSKTGPKVIRLSKPALEYLRSIPRLEGNPYVLPGRRGKGHLVGLTRCWDRIRQAAGLGDVRIHDLRHTFASAGLESGLSLLMIGRLLGHRSSATTNRYAHLVDDPALEAANRISDQLAIVKPKSSSASENAPSASS